MLPSLTVEGARQQVSSGFREASAPVGRTADCKHYLAIKRARVGWREEVGWLLLIRPR